MFEGRTVLSTERLRLRSLRKSDLAPLAALNGDPEVMRYLGGTMTAEASHAFARVIEIGFVESGIGKLAVERKADGAFLGLCGLSREIWYPDELEIGYRLASEHWGQGYALEAARAWVAYAFATLAAPRVISISEPQNLRSIAVMKRLGMRYDHQAELADGDDVFPAVIYALDAP